MDKSKTEAPKTPWIQRQLGGTAMIAGASAVGGAIWHAYKKRPLMNGIKGGAIVGVIGSIGFGGDFYDSVFGSKKTSFADIIEAERAKDSSTKQL
jgi:hypothetical protein